MENYKIIVAALADYNYRRCGETLEQCPINIVSRTDIPNEEAELVRFTYGTNACLCVAIIYNDGTAFTPWDWLSREWEDEDWKIEDTEWCDSRPMRAIMFNGMPRIFA